MFKKDKPVRDVFRFSLGGVQTVTPFVAAPAVADDQFKEVSVRRDSTQRPWLCFYHQAAHFPCA